MSPSFSLCAALGLALLLSACGTEQKIAPAAVAVAPVIKDGSLMTPGKPQISPVRGRAVPGAQPITWNMYWGENGRHWAVYVNGKEVQSGDLALETPKQQQATVEVPMEQPGTYEIKVALCNDHGCSESEPAMVNVGAG
ncbi:MAG: chitinase N-terminal domain-containing protein [Pedobacter sp.]|nr:chitinase N-terminal domain-containing protein [Pedobacter sp.]